MKKKLIMFLTCCCLLTGNATYADNLSMNATTQTSLVTDINVKVVKYVNDEEVIVYTGPVSQYNNGLCTSMDFEKYAFAIILEWENPDVVYYIYPIETDNGITSSTTVDKTINETNEQVGFLSEIEVVEPSLNITASYYKNNTLVSGDYNNTNISGGDELLARYIISNSGTTVQNVQMILCIYDGDERLVNVVSVDDNILVNDTKTIEKNILVPGNISECYAKVMLWDSLSGLYPLLETVQIGETNTTQDVVTASISCVENKEYNLVTTVENMPSNDEGVYTITYNPSILELVDLCSLTYKREMETGLIGGTNITILSVDTVSGEIVFKNPNEDNNSVSKVLNSVKFRGLVSGEQTVITIE